MRPTKRCSHRLRQTSPATFARRPHHDGRNTPLARSRCEEPSRRIEAGVGGRKRPISKATTHRRARMGAERVGAPSRARRRTRVPAPSASPLGSACSTKPVVFREPPERARSPTLCSRAEASSTHAISCRTRQSPLLLRPALVERQSARQGPVRSSAHADPRAQTRAADRGTAEVRVGRRRWLRDAVGVALALG